MIKPMAFNEKIVRVATWNGRKKTIRRRSL